MNPTAIEWVVNPDGTPGYTKNPFVGCSHRGCAVWPLCYAAKSAKRQKNRCPRCYTFTPHVHRERMLELSKLEYRKEPIGMFLDSMSDFLDPAFGYSDLRWMLDCVKKAPQHRFYLLTKQAQLMHLFIYPPNLWLGVTINNRADLGRLKYLSEAKGPQVKFVSFEPLYEDLGPEISKLKEYGVSWVIIGPQTKPYREANIVGLIRILRECKKHRIARFVKNMTTSGPYSSLNTMIKEFPKV